MLKTYELSGAFRYLRSRSRNRFVSFISLISVFGIALAVAVLIIVLSVMNGFESELRGRILSVISHASVSGFNGQLDDWQRLTDIAEAQPEGLYRQGHAGLCTRGVGQCQLRSDGP